MNKQEAIKKVEQMGEYERFVNESIPKLSVLNILNQLDEPKKPVVPQFVADWIEYCKFTHVDLQHALIVGDVYFYNYANQKDFSKLKAFLETENNQENFARAWLDGYEVEEEKRYYIRLKIDDKNYSYLNYIKHLSAWCLAEIKKDKKFRTEHTRKQLEDAGFGEVFNSTLFEVEEVEE